MPAPSKLTPELQKRLCDLLAAGNFLEIACMLTPISVPVVYQWLALGRGETLTVQTRRGVRVRKGEPQHRAFVEAYDRACAEAENVAVVTMGLAMQGKLPGDSMTDGKPDGKRQGADWHAARDFLRFRYPNRWNRSYRDVEVATNGTVSVVKPTAVADAELQAKLLDDPEAFRLAHELAERLNSPKRALPTSPP